MQEYTKTDRQIHWLSQVIAKVDRGLLPEKEDDSHTNLYFDPISKKLAGRWVETPVGEIMLVLNLEANSFEWLNKQLQNQFTLSFIGNGLAELEKEIIKFPESLGLNIAEIAKPLHFEIPDYTIRSIQEGEMSREGLKTWINIRELANNASLAILGYVQTESEIRIWPHHFDTGIYGQINTSLGIGFGLAMEDAMLGEPYFYLSAYSSGAVINYENLPVLDSGKWIAGEYWNGAVLPLSEFKDIPTELALRKIKNYIKQSVTWLLNQCN